MHLPAMPGPEELNRPLSRDDLEALSVALDQPGGHNTYMAIGLVSAVATAAMPILPSTWLPMVLGDYEVHGPDDPVLGLVLRLYNMVSAGFATGQLMCPLPHEIERIEQFCIGYVMGVDLDDTWIEDIDAMEPVFPIAVLTGDQPLNDPDDEDHIEDEEGWKQNAREQLPDLVGEAFEKLAPARRRMAPKGGGWVRDKPKVGRNEPCPCGSGKKYKKCCLS